MSSDAKCPTCRGNQLINAAMLRTNVDFGEPCPTCAQALASGAGSPVAIELALDSMRQHQLKHGRIIPEQSRRLELWPELVAALEQVLTRTVVKRGRYTLCLTCKYIVTQGGHEEDCLIPGLEALLARIAPAATGTGDGESKS